MFRNKHKTSQYYFQCLSWQFASVLQGDWWLGQTDSTCRHPVVCFLSGLWWCVVCGYVLVFSVNTVMWCEERVDTATLDLADNNVWCSLQTPDSFQPPTNTLAELWREMLINIPDQLSVRSATIDTETHRTLDSCWLHGGIRRKMIKYQSQDWLKYCSEMLAISKWTNPAWRIVWCGGADWRHSAS